MGSGMSCLFYGDGAVVLVLDSGVVDEEVGIWAGCTYCLRGTGSVGAMCLRRCKRL